MEKIQNQKNSNMDNDAFLAVEKMRSRLSLLLEAWHAKLYVSIVSVITYEEVRTSSGYSDDIGSITMVHRPENRPKVRISQTDEFAEIEMPWILDYEIKPVASFIRAHTDALEILLQSKAPTPEQWEAASKPK